MEKVLQKKRVRLTLSAKMKERIVVESLGWYEHLLFNLIFILLGRMGALSQKV